MADSSFNTAADKRSAHNAMPCSGVPLSRPWPSMIRSIFIGAIELADVSLAMISGGSGEHGVQGGITRICRQ